MYQYIKFIILLLTTGIPSLVYSQSFRNLSVKEGLSDLVVNTIYKDEAGYMWFGTSSSVECFDGHRFKHYPVPENSDRSQDVNGLTRQTLWGGRTDANLKTVVKRYMIAQKVSTFAL